MSRLVFWQTAFYVLLDFPDVMSFPNVLVVFFVVIFFYYNVLPSFSYVNSCSVLSLMCHAYLMRSCLYCPEVERPSAVSTLVRLVPTCQCLVMLVFIKLCWVMLQINNIVLKSIFLWLCHNTYFFQGLGEEKVKR